MSLTHFSGYISCFRIADSLSVLASHALQEEMQTG